MSKVVNPAQVQTLSMAQFLRPEGDKEFWAFNKSQASDFGFKNGDPTCFEPM
jgi:hypothetical protein